MRKLLLQALVLALLTAADVASSADDARPAIPESPVAPADTLQYFVTHPDCRIELVASEPDVMSPIQVAFDADGRMWVMEYSDYPNGPAEGEPGRSRIRVLSDDDGDGRFENPQTFVDKLLFATGLAFWRDGVIVTSQGSVDFFRDTDGDGRADDRETWFRGFSEGNPQLRANAPTFAVDNHFYIASGLRGGEVIAVREGWAKDAQPVNLSSRDFRFDPVTGAYESVTGPSQFGIAIDDWGNRFTCDNRTPCRHVVIEDRYAQRNPNYAIAKTTHDVAASGEQSHVFPISNFWTTSNLHEGQFTAACGICNYRGHALPAQFHGQHFVCDPTGNFVHCEMLEAQGATFTSHPERDGVEFLASTDSWFRPVNLTVGPDGALYVVDMYRAVIEHPQWMPEELKNRPDLELGMDRGRIYRVVSHDAPAGKPVLERSFRKKQSHDLVHELAHWNSWQRETAHRLLFERLTEAPDPSVIELLKAITSHPTSIEIHSHRLWLLHGLGELDAKTLNAGLGDVATVQTPSIVEQAARIAEHYEPTIERTRWIAKLAAEGAWTDDRLAFQCLLSLSAFPLTDDTIPLVAKAACKHGGDPWVPVAVTLTARDQSAAVLEAALDFAPGDADVSATTAVVRELAVQTGRSGDPELVGRMLERAGRTPQSDDEKQAHTAVYEELVLGLAEGAARAGQSWDQISSQCSESARQKLEVLYAEAAQQAGADNSVSDQTLAILKLAPWEIARDPLLTLAAGDNQSLRIAAINALARRGAPEVDEFLLDGFAGQTPAVKPALLSALFASSARINKLLDEIEAGNIAAREIDVARTGQLLKHRDPAIKQRAQALLSANVNSDRQQVYDEYAAALQLEADPQRGREVFLRTCVQCHRIGNLGVDVAPAISDVGRTQTREQILLSILDPNRAIDNNYFSYTVLEHSGAVHTGVIAAETATSVTLRQPEGKQVTVLRSDIDELTSNGISLMPVGVEKDINQQQMADLVSFIKNWRYLDGAVPGVGGQ